MKRILASSNAFAALVFVAGSFGLATPAAAQIPIPVPVPIIAPPPPVFVATTPPVYYEGRATYWYGDHWVYRDARGWHRYEREPAYLHEHRAHRQPRPHYEHGHRR